MKIPVRAYFKLLYKYIKHQTGQVILLGILIISSIGLQLVFPQVVRFFIDQATKSGTSRSLTVAALIFIGAAALQQVIAVACTYISQNVGWTSTNNLRADLMKHLIKLDISFHKSRQPGELMERLDGDVNALFNFFSALTLNLGTNLLLLAGILLLLFREDWSVGIALSVFAASAMVILWKLQGIAVPYWVKEREINAKFFGFVGEQITNTEDVRSSGAVPYIIHKFHDFLRRWYPIKRKANILGYSMWLSALLLFGIGNAVAFGISGYLWKKHLITIGTVYLIFNYTELLTRPIESIRWQLQDLQRAGASIERINELFNVQPTLQEGQALMASEGPLGLVVNHVSFHYEDDVPVLKDINFSLKPGRTLGILGRTGSGKSTLARLLIRLYDPTEGAISLGNLNLKEYSFNDLRRSSAFVTQDVQLFRASLRDNLTFFNKSIEDETILKAIKDAGMEEWFEKLLMGLDTMLDAEGGGFSAGQSQLLAFVRVFLRNPGMIILDEASSRLDPITEQLMEKAIDKLLEGRSCVMIAHHLKTIERADDILILEDGRIVEYGTREELLQDPESRFCQLLKAGIEEVLV